MKRGWESVKNILCRFAVCCVLLAYSVVFTDRLNAWGYEMCPLGISAAAESTAGEYYESPRYAELADKCSGNSRIGAFTDYKTLVDRELDRLISLNSAERQQLVTDLLTRAGTVYVSGSEIDFTDMEFTDYLNYASANVAELKRYLKHYGITSIANVPLTIDFVSNNSLQTAFYRSFLINAYNSGVSSILIKNKDVGIVLDLLSFAPLSDSSYYSVSITKYNSVDLPENINDSIDAESVYQILISDESNIIKEISDAYILFYAASDSDIICYLSDEDNASAKTHLVNTNYDGMVISFPLNDIRMFFIDESEDAFSVIFADVPKSHWAYKYIEGLAKCKIISGADGEMFAPDANITREQFVTMLAKAINIEDENAECSFDDVHKEDWYYPYVASANACGIVHGTSETEFGSGESISRQDMAVMTWRAIEYAKADMKHYNMMPNFKDAGSIAGYAVESAAQMQYAGIIEGTDDGCFNPYVSATRAEAAKVIYMIKFKIWEGI